MDLSWFVPFLSQLATQLPVILVCLAGLVVLLVKRQSLGAGFVMGAAGFLLLLICIVGSLLTWRVIWLLSDRHSAWFTLSTILWAILRAGAYGLLLGAILVGRSTSRR